MRRLFAALALVLTVPCSLVAQDAPMWLRYPAISPDGSQIAFSYQGDLYVVPASGGTAIQRTTYSGYDAMPVWSPDGSHIAFASDRYGNLDVFVMPAEGGTPTRLTHHSAADHPSDFTPDGQHVLFTSSRTDRASSAAFPSGVLSELYQVQVAGGTPEMVLTTPAEQAVYNRDGSALLFHDRKGYEDPWRKKHTSSVTRDVWRYTLADSSYTKVADWQGEDRNPVWSPDESGLYYLSEQGNGTFNVHHKPFGGAATALTDFPMHPVRFLTTSDDGLLCFAQDGELYTMRQGESPQKITVRLTRDAARTDAIQTVTSGATQMAVSPNGKEIAFIYRGDVFVTSTETSTTKQVTQTPTQERSVAFHPEGRTLVYAGERNGAWNLYEATIARDDEPYFYTATLINETPLVEGPTATFQPAYSPEGKEVAYLEDRTTLRVIERATKTSRTVVPGTNSFSYADGDQHYAWSPDGKWFLIEYTQPGYWPTEVGLVKADGTGVIVNLTQSGYPDSSPQWMMGGKMLLWFSDRNGLRGWAGSSAREVDAYALFFTDEAYERFSLSKEEFTLLKEREDKAKKDKKADEQDDAEKADSTTTIEIDLDGIEDRQARLTIHSSRMGGAAVTPDGSKLVYLARFEKGYDLWVTDLRTKETKILAKLGANGASLELSKDGKHVYLLSGGRFSKVAIEGGKRTSIGYSSEMVLDAPAEREYIFWHAWQQSIDKFYDPTLHGIRAQWDTLGHAYARHLPHIANGYDFADLLGELLGELNASHSGARYTHRAENADATASLGVFYDTDYTGKGVRIAEVMNDGPLDRAESQVTTGTIVEMIDGEAITPQTNLYGLLNRKAGDRVRLSLLNPSTQESWEEVVKPISLGAENQLRYDRWVKQRRALVDSLSDGRLGYVHVQSMSDGSYRTVIEEVLGRHVTKEGLVVDTRFNGGGDLVDDLSTFLTGTRYADFISPDGRVIGTEPQRRWHKPSVMLMSEGNYSDAHCTPYAYNALNIGKLVGMPVAGTCSFVWWERQQDSSIRFGLPNMAMTDAAQRPLENLQLEPDVRVENTPSATARGEDAQLQRAVQVLLDELD
ncbi:MAG: S41 family peptidase [Rhodothermales bacterium]